MGASEGQPRKRMARASGAIKTASPAPKKSRRGASHKGVDKGVLSGSQVVPPFVAVPPSLAVEVDTLIEELTGDKLILFMSPLYRRTTTL